MDIKDIPTDEIVTGEAEVEAIGENEIINGEVVADREAYDMKDVYATDESLDPCPDLGEESMLDPEDVPASETE